MSIAEKNRVPVEQLRWQCDPDSLGFETTDELTYKREIFGQERALKAIKLGLDVKSPGYNIYVAGLTGTGKTTTIKHLLEQIDTTGDIPEDICYVHNFSQTDSPKALKLPPGQGKELAREMDELVNSLRQTIPQIFESEEFKKRTKQLLAEYEQRSKELFRKIEEKVKKASFAIVQIQTGPFIRPEIFPVIDDKVVPWDQVQTMVDEEKLSERALAQLQKKRDELMEEMEKSLRENRDIQKEAKKAIEKFKHQFCAPVVRDLIRDLKEKFDSESVHTYLDDVEAHVLNDLDRFREGDEGKQEMGPMEAMAPPADEFLEFKVNVIVDNARLERVPVIIENTPNYKHLFGTIERVQDRTGIWHTDFTKIRAGSLLRANGGYLVLNLLDALLEPGVWPALKRTLKNRQVDIQSFDPFYLYSTFALKPEPVDIDVKVVAVGDSFIYQLLYSHDEDFRKIFKVKADFDTEIGRNDVALKNYAAFVRNICEEEALLPFSNAAVAEVIEYGVRLAGRQNKITTRFSDIADLLREAHYWAKQDNSKVVSGDHVNKAIDEKIYRSRMIEDKIQEMMEEGMLLIDIDGEKVGQVNGLTIYALGDYAFGRPAKITAEVSMGRAGIINIEREAKLSGKTHDKGVLIIGGYFRGKYAQDKPLTMSASLAFEQSYSGVDGDSASSTEIYAILSELADLPLRQDIAVTGSVNQKGEIQPIGGVNQKIEGFYEVCNARGLTGNQGVLIPQQNVKDLMLKPQIVEAVEEGKFHIYAIGTIDEGIELLTGVPAGNLQKDGGYPEESVHGLVDHRLRELALNMRRFYDDDDRKAGNTRRRKK